MDNRGIDILVAEKVLGGSIEERTNVCRFLYDRNGTQLAIQEWYSGEWVYNALPYFSLDIAAAWQVIYRWNSLGWHWEIASGKSKIHVTVLTDADENFAHSGRAITAPLAICLAALKAVGVELEAGQGRGKDDYCATTY